MKEKSFPSAANPNYICILQGATQNYEQIAMADIESWLFPNTRMTKALREGENNVVVSFCNRKGTTYRNVRNSVTVYG